MKKEIYSAIPMDRFGIKTLALTPHRKIEDIRDKFIHSPDNSWFSGCGKKVMHKFLKSSLLDEDAYFNEHLDEAISTNQRWTNFIDDCVIFAVLDMIVNQGQLILLHPSSYEEYSFANKISSDVKPELVYGIESY